MSVEDQVRKITPLWVEAKAACASGDIPAFLALIEQVIPVFTQLREALLSDPAHVFKDPETQRFLDQINFTALGNLDSLGSQLLGDLVLPSEYAMGLQEVTVLTTPVPLPESLRTFVQEARQCYALRQPNAVYSLSRTILEAAVNDICVATGRMPARIVEEDLFFEERWFFRTRLQKVCASIKIQRIEDHYKILCGVVHGTATVSREQALAALTETVAHVHYLYLINQEPLKSRK